MRQLGVSAEMMLENVTRGVVAVLLSCAALSCSAAPAEEETAPSGSTEQELLGGLVGRATLRDAAGQRVGTVVFTPAPHGTTAVSVAVSLGAGQEGMHGFHVHANDDPSNGQGCVADPDAPASTHFVSADGHFRMEGTHHGDHAGDLPALLVQHRGTAAMSLTTDRFRVPDVIGRAVIVHALPDNYGNVPVGSAANEYTPNSPEATAATAATGNAGARLACGVIH